jgi:hypothetical protein
VGERSIGKSLNEEGDGGGDARSVDDASLGACERLRVGIVAQGP